MTAPLLLLKHFAGPHQVVFHYPGLYPHFKGMHERRATPLGELGPFE